MYVVLITERLININVLVTRLKRQPFIAFKKILSECLYNVVRPSSHMVIFFNLSYLFLLCISLTILRANML